MTELSGDKNQVRDERAASDFSKAFSYFPAITAMAVLVLSIFNIGYFSKIGLHFLGVMDLSNFVYSLSFLIAVMTGSLGVYFWGDYVEVLIKNIGDAAGRRTIYWSLGAFFGSAAVVIALVMYFYPPARQIHFPNDRFIAILWVVGAALLLAAHYSRWIKAGQIGIGNGFFSFVFTVLAIYWVGRAVAEHEIYTVKDSYSFTLKDRAVPLVGKLLRTSSSGFIVFVNNKVGFVPLSEVKQVIATDDLVD